MDILSTIGNAADKLSTVGLAIFFIVALIQGYLLTKSHHEEVVKQMQESEKRAWDMVEEAKDALAANNEVLERQAAATEALRGIIDTVMRLGKR